jgi:hypothetical protein
MGRRGGVCPSAPALACSAVESDWPPRTHTPGHYLIRLHQHNLVHVRSTRQISAHDESITVRSHIDRSRHPPQPQTKRVLGRSLAAHTHDFVRPDTNFGAAMCGERASDHARLILRPRRDGVSLAPSLAPPLHQERPWTPTAHDQQQSSRVPFSLDYSHSH